MSRKPTKEMIDRGVAFALNAKLSSEYSWSQYVSDLYQHMDAGRDPASAPDGWVMVPDEPTESMLVAATIAASQMQDAMGLKELNKKRRNVYKAMLSTAPQPPAPAVDVEAVRGTIFRMKDNHKLRESRCKPDPLISIWANELARAIGDET